MQAYIIRRLLIWIPSLLLLSLLIFILVNLMPGEITDAMVGSMGVEEIDKEAVMRRLGLDAPLVVQYGRWMGVLPHVDGNFRGLFQGNFGVSWWYGVSVGELIAIRWPVTLQLSLMGLIIAQLIALPIGIYSALRQDTAADYIGRSFAIGCISIPDFWLGTLVLVLPAIWWGYMPSMMLIPFTEDPIGNLRMFIVPAIILAMTLSGITTRMSRSMMLEVLRQDYIRTAWAKGHKERVVILRHALKNALIPVITVVGLQLPIMIGGTVIIEQIFMLPGMGRLLISAALNRDRPLVSGIVLVYSVGLVLINIVVDLTYVYLDPRVHY